MSPNALLDYTSISSRPFNGETKGIAKRHRRYFTAENPKNNGHEENVQPRRHGGRENLFAEPPGCILHTRVTRDQSSPLWRRAGLD